MVLEFCGSDNFTLGVEIELQVLNRETLDLTPQADLIIQKAKSINLKRVKPEIHKSMLEIDSEISTDVKECRQFLQSRSKSLSLIADEMGLKLATSGTHPFQRWRERQFSKNERYQSLHTKYQWLARRMNVYGLHVHVGVKTGKLALAVCNLLVKYLPHLLALSANSPFWQGVDTGMNSSRINIMDSFPFGGTPKQFNSWSDFEHYYETLKRIGVIESLKDLYWYIRPNLEYGTVELRVCDAMASLDETMVIAALFQSLVAYSIERLENDMDHFTMSKEMHWLAPENQFIAARDGLDGLIVSNAGGKREKISESLLRLKEELEPIAKKLNCYEEIQMIDCLIKKGNGASRQREIYKNSSSLKEVVLGNINEFYQSIKE
jgi:carboxylate-amine ligase